MNVFLAISPVLLIFLLMTWARRSADVAGVAGWVFTALLAAAWFHTSWQVIFVGSLAGIVASLPISLMVVASILQINVMEALKDNQTTFTEKYLHNLFSHAGFRQLCARKHAAGNPR